MSARLVGATVRVLSGVEGAVRRVLPGSRLDGSGSPAHIAAYDGYGTHRAITAFGRAVRSLPPPPARAEATMWENFVATYRRFGAHEIAGARVRVRVGGAEGEVTSDADGMFTCRLPLESALPADRPWYEVEYAFVSPAPPYPRPVRGRIYVPPATAGFGVISDIDDTVVRTDVGRLVRMVSTTVFGNAHTRLPFPGVAAFYQALQAGADRGGPNPLFYVSSSPWNLRELLAELFELRGIPAGPILLRDWSADPGGPRRGQRRMHKVRVVNEVLAAYPHLRFILIGDSGQEDPEIYASIAAEHPGRILSIYIRDVTRTGRRAAEINSIGALARRAGCELVLVPDTLAAARHAAARGWIAPEALGAVSGVSAASDATAGACIAAGRHCHG